MSAGPAREGQAGPVPDRRAVLSLLERELRAAEVTGQPGYAARVRARIALLSAGASRSPARETTRSIR